MTKPISKFGCSIPELKTVITKYGCGLGKSVTADGPPYVVVGQFYSDSGPIGGILAAAQDEFSAHAILREVNKKGTAKVYRSEFHSAPNFSIASYKDQIRAKMEEQRLADEQAKLSEKIPEVKKTSLKLVK
jgi:hypothetical protein